MNLACAHRQLETQELLSLLTAIDRTRARYNIPNPIGGLITRRSPRPVRIIPQMEALAGDALSQTLENVPRQDAECDRRALSEIPSFHSQPDSAERRENNGC